MYAPATDYDKEQVDRSIDEVKAGFPNDVERIVYRIQPYFAFTWGSEQERLGEPEWDISGVFWKQPILFVDETGNPSYASPHCIHRLLRLVSPSGRGCLSTLGTSHSPGETVSTV